jgi:flavin-dependent dehydrogenase/2-polyprenyl-3-methyl-5-hydroxy-6-metoxy-1,4-benzoquinol methylase
MRTRVLIPERMDDPELDRDEHARALRGLQRINAWTGNAALVWKHISNTAREIGARPLRVLDIATGSADVPIALLGMSASHGVKVEIDACDFSAQAIAIAAEKCAAANAAVRLFRHDIVRDEIADRYDVVMCSQFLHHLTNEQVAVVLRKMKSAAARRVVVVDLERSAANWLQVWIATRVLTRSKVVHFDGPQSVRAAFTIDEFNRIAKEIGFASFEIRRKWPCRFVFVGETDGSVLGAGLPTSPLPATIRLDAASGVRWDLVVIGAGPAGAMAAREAARGGARVLLVDRASFPRPKVCGCCINGAAIEVLSQVGLGDLLRQNHAQELRAVRLASAGRFATIRLSEGVSLSRERFDTALIQAAIAAGAEFLDQTQALIGEVTPDSRVVVLKIGTVEQSASAKAIVVAGGLGCRVFAIPDSDERLTSQSSRVGAGTVLDVAPAEYSDGTIYMACHKHGYVGLVRLEDDRLDLAAALDADAIKQHGGIAALVSQILAYSDLPIPEALASASWHGTGRLTQHREHVVAERCFFIGDAAGYVEPFTGEGMACALASGRAVAPIVFDFLRHDRGSEAMQAWTDTHRRLIAKRARLCRYVTRMLRYPAFVRLAVRLLAFAPWLARPVVRSLNASFDEQSTSR